MNKFVRGAGAVLDGAAWLFCPADRPDRFAKAGAAADVVILDLEDGVAPADRERARSALRDSRLDPSRTVVRISAAGTEDHGADLAVVRATHYRTVMLAKTESAAQVAALAPLGVVALCETPLGVLEAAEIGRVANVVAMMWGAEDLMAALGGASSRSADGQLRDVAKHARNAVLLAASAAGKPAVDAVYLDVANPHAFHNEARESAGEGFGAKACIHPTQARIARDAYRPSAAEVEFAHRVLDARDALSAGVFLLDGRMIDEPVIRQAHRVVARQQP